MMVEMGRSEKGKVREVGARILKRRGVRKGEKAGKVGECGVNSLLAMERRLKALRVSINQ